MNKCPALFLEKRRQRDEASSLCGVRRSIRVVLEELTRQIVMGVVLKEILRGCVVNSGVRSGWD